MPAAQHKIRMSLIKRIRTKHPGPETPSACGVKPTFGRKRAKSALSLPEFQGVFQSAAERGPLSQSNLVYPFPPLSLTVLRGNVTN